MLKVIELVPTLDAGGAETMIKDYCLLFDKNKIDVQVVVIDCKKWSYNEEILEKAGIKITYLGDLMYGFGRQLNVIQKIFRKFSRYYYWRKLVLAEQPDVIHMHLHLGNYLKILPLRRMNCKLVMTIHNVFNNFFETERSSRDKYKEFKEVYRLVHEYGMKLIALRDDLRDELMEKFDTKEVLTINNGIVIDRFDADLYDRSKIRENLGLRDNDFVIGNVGSLSPQKNHELILDVFEQISHNNPSAKLLLVGKGGHKEYIEKRIVASNLQDKVFLLSNRSDIPELMKTMDVFFFPSKWEGFGNVMIEAQSMGLRCVISDAVPLCTIVTDRVSICNLSDSIDVWADAIQNTDYPTWPVNNSIKEYDMRGSVSKLECLYYEMSK